eukprot:CAMPEP_0197892786 /NCGR_PEP_ID=MMETSP1439-20131203/31617_1 /TAXON_ID=66791 /ORGANISM="Gonyaulax spinifera, Strain CCMP409" /LENGTH=83 /DNA_ID=CAMNT_0043512993 /DNA_START=71 /DNA_END=318 /DNA_ORIENTATION=-
MARSSARCLLLGAALAVLALQLCAPGAFVPPPQAGAWAPAAAGVAAGSLVSFPAWAYSTEVVDAQLLLARIPGGKFAKEKNLV